MISEAVELKLLLVLMSLEVLLNLSGICGRFFYIHIKWSIYFRFTTVLNFCSQGEF